MSQQAQPPPPFGLENARGLCRPHRALGPTRAPGARLDPIPTSSLIPTRTRVWPHGRAVNPPPTIHTSRTHPCPQPTWSKTHTRLPRPSPNPTVTAMSRHTPPTPRRPPLCPPRSLTAGCSPVRPLRAPRGHGRSVPGGSGIPGGVRGSRGRAVRVRSAAPRRSARRPHGRYREIAAAPAAARRGRLRRRIPRLPPPLSAAWEAAAGRGEP